jgi:hypothetical protein
MELNHAQRLVLSCTGELPEAGVHEHPHHLQAALERSADRGRHLRLAEAGALAMMVEADGPCPEARRLVSVVEIRDSAELDSHTARLGRRVAYLLLAFMQLASTGRGEAG